MPHLLRYTAISVAFGAANLSIASLAFAISIVAICSANDMAAADSSTIPSEDRDPSDELRDKFDLGFDSNGALRQYDKELNGITERTFQFDVHNGDKKENQERRNSLGTRESCWILEEADKYPFQMCLVEFTVCLLILVHYICTYCGKGVWKREPLFKGI